MATRCQHRAAPVGRSVHKESAIAFPCDYLDAESHVMIPAFLSEAVSPKPVLLESRLALPVLLESRLAFLYAAWMLTKRDLTTAEVQTASVRLLMYAAKSGYASVFFSFCPDTTLAPNPADPVIRLKFFGSASSQSRIATLYGSALININTFAPQWSAEQWLPSWALVDSQF